MYTYQGKDYKTLKSLCDDLGIRYSVTRQKLYRGYSLEDAVKPDSSQCTYAHLMPVVADGITFHSVRALSKYLGVSTVKTEHLIHKEINLDGFKEKLATEKKSYTVEGKSYSSLTAVGEKYGIEVSTISSRINYGWTLEQACELHPPPERSDSKKVTINGVMYPSISAAAKRTGVPMERISKMVKEQGLAINLPIHMESFSVLQPELKKYEVVWDRSCFDSLVENLGNRNKYVLRTPNRELKISSLKSLAQIFEITPRTVSSRLTSGWTLSQAVSLHPGPNAVKIDIDGSPFYFSTMRYAIKFFKCDEIKVRSRLREKWSIEEALGIEQRSKLRGRYRVLIDGVEYESIADYARYQGISYHTVSSRFHEGRQHKQSLVKLNNASFS